MLNNMNEVARNLVEGSVWENKNGKIYTVIFVSNLSVSRKLADRFVPSVVFLNQENDIFTMDCETFLTRYHFLEVNDVVAQSVDRVYQANLGQEEDVASELINEAEETIDMASEVEEVEEQEADPTLAEKLIAPRYSIEFIGDYPDCQVLANDELQNAFAGYSSYLDSMGAIFHKLYFTPSVDIDSIKLASTFDPQLYGDEKNTYQYINVKTEDADYNINWDAFGAVNVELRDGKEFIVVVLMYSPEARNGVEPIFAQPCLEPSEEVIEGVEEQIEEGSTEVEQSVTMVDGEPVIILSENQVDEQPAIDVEQPSVEVPVVSLSQLGVHNHLVTTVEQITEGEEPQVVEHMEVVESGQPIMGEPVIDISTSEVEDLASSIIKE